MGAAFLNPGINVERKIYSGQREQSARQEKWFLNFQHSHGRRKLGGLMNAADNQFLAQPGRAAIKSLSSMQYLQVFVQSFVSILMTLGKEGGELGHRRLSITPDEYRR